MRILGGIGQARLPLREGREAYSLTYYVEALAPSGFVLRSLGTADEPLTLAVPEAMVPEVGEGGLLVRDERPIPLDGTILPLDPALFTEALVFRDAASGWMRFTGPDGAAIRMEMSDFPHLAVWTKPAAPFLSLECWTGHADWVGFEPKTAVTEGIGRFVDWYLDWYRPGGSR